MNSFSNSDADTEWATPPQRLILPDDGVHVWRVLLSRTPTEIQGFSSLLAPDELDRAARYRFERDRGYFVAARGMLRTILGRYLNQDPAQLGFSYSAYGKPALIGTTGPNSLRFNMAHSREMALLAVTRDRELGVDIEYVRAEFADGKIAENYFSSTELAMLRSLSATDRVAGFFNCWTRKEAYLKARGEGLSFPLDQFDVSLIPGEDRVSLNVPDSEIETARWSLRPLFPGHGYAGAIAVEGHDWRLSCWQEE